VVGDVVGRCAIGGPLRAISIIASTASSSALSKRTGIAIDTLSRPVLKNDLLDAFGAVDYANNTKLACARIASVGLVVGIFQASLAESIQVCYESGRR